MTPSRAPPLTSTQSIGCDDTRFTLVLQGKRRRIYPR
jgi:hypothetical protein